MGWRLLKLSHSWYVCFFLKGHKTHSSTKLKSFLSSREGKLAAAVVREFLEFFELHFTASVFEPEAEAVSDEDRMYTQSAHTSCNPQAASHTFTHKANHSQRATHQPAVNVGMICFKSLKDSHRSTVLAVYVIVE